MDDASSSGRDSATLAEGARTPQAIITGKENARPASVRNATNSHGIIKKSDLLNEKHQYITDTKHGLDGNGAITVTDGFRPLEEKGDINYHTMSWVAVGMLMIAETISLGILSLPSVYTVVGLPAGIIMIIGLGLLATYTGYNIGLFKMAYPHVKNQADAGEVMGGPILREILGAAQIIFLTFVVASHVLTGLIALETIANDSTCTIVWSVIISVAGCALTFPRTLRKLSWLSVGAFTSILSAIFICMISVGVRGKIGIVSARAAPGTTFRAGFVAASDIIFAYAGHAAFFNFIHEMKRPQDYDKALYMLQGADISLYLVTSVVIYYYVGDNAISPALGNLGLTMRRIAYGVAIPTILMGGVINGSVACRLAMQRIFKPDSPHYKSNTKFGWFVWTCLVVGIWLLGWIIANVIPFFNELLSLLTALFASFFTYAISGVFFLFLNPRETWFKGTKMTLFTLLNMFIIAMASLIMVAGLYASISSIIDGYKSDEFPGPFSCTLR